MSDFSITRDWKEINWKATFQYNVFRSVCALPGFLILSLITKTHFPLAMLLFPVFYFAFMLPFGLLCAWLSKIGVPFVWMLSWLCSFVIIVGDPFVWIISKIKPNLVPIEKPKFLNFTLLVFVTHNPDAIPDCPFSGRIVSDENVQLLNEVFPLRKTLFIIKEDWSVETLKDKYFGFVDLNGVIKKGRLQKGIDPRETTIGEIVAYIVDGICYNQQKQRIGQYDIADTTAIQQPLANIDNKQLSDKLSGIADKRKLVKTDFPEGYGLCPFAGNVEAIQDETFLDINWSAQEMIFDIDYRGFVKTPYNDFFGYVEDNGDIMKDTEEDTEPTKIASIKGKFCYADNQKIGQFVKQTN